MILQLLVLLVVVARRCSRGLMQSKLLVELEWVALETLNGLFVEWSLNGLPWRLNGLIWTCKTHGFRASFDGLLVPAKIEST